MSMQEYFRLIGMECSETLHQKLECALIRVKDPSPKRYAMINPNWLGDCPMHDTDGLCMLHRECGIEALSSVCRLYPRRLQEHGGKNICVCSTSCEAVVEMLMQETKPLTLREEELEVTAVLHDEDRDETYEKMRIALRLLQKRAMPLTQRLAVLCGCEGMEGDCVKAFAQTMDMLSHFSAFSSSLEEFGADAILRYGAGDREAYAVYQQDAQRFESHAPHWRELFERILTNHMLYVEYPDVDNRVSQEEARCAVAGLYALMLSLIHI